MNFHFVKTILFLGLFLFASQASSRIRLKLIFTHKLGVDNNMVLESELHSIEDVFESEHVSLTMQEGLRLNLQAHFIQREEDYGPSSLISVEGKIYDRSGSLLKEIDSKESLFEIGEKKTLSQLTDEGRKIELTIVPTVQ